MTTFPKTGLGSAGGSADHRGPNGALAAVVESSTGADKVNGVPADAWHGDTADDPHASDAQLVHQVRAGQIDAFGILVQRYERRLLRTLRRFVFDTEWARDVAQEAFLRVYQRLDEFDCSRRFGPWLFRIAVNLAVDQLRQRRRSQRSIAVVANGELGRLRRRDDTTGRELAEEVHVVLERIPLKYRTVLMLRDLEGFTCSEVAAILNRREATVRWRLCKAREQFRKLWLARNGDHA